MADHHLYDVASPLSLAAADAVADAAIAAGRGAGLLPLTVAVLDAGGHVVVLKREDGCGTARAAIATGKAAAALGMGIPTRTIRDRLADRPAFQSQIAAATDAPFIGVPGGVLILNADGVAIGAVGISGDASDRDEYAAIAGVKAAGLTPAPAQPVEGWQGAGL